MDSHRSPLLVISRDHPGLNHRLAADEGAFGWRTIKGPGHPNPGRARDAAAPLGLR